MNRAPESSTGFVDTAVSLLLRWRMLLLPLVGVLACAAWPIARQIEFDQSIESLYAQDDLHFSEYAFSKAVFGGDEFAIVAWREVGLFESPPALDAPESDATATEPDAPDPDASEPESVEVSARSRVRIEALANRLIAVPGIYPQSVQHVSGALAFPYKRERVAELINGVLTGTDGETTAVLVRLKPEAESTVSRGETIARIRRIAADHDPPAFVVGEPVQIHDMFRYVEEDGRVLFRVSLCLLAAVLMMLFRSLRWVLLPLVIVVLTIRFTEALLVLSGTKLSMVSSMLNSLVTIIGVATATHIAVGFRERRLTMSRSLALQNTLIELLPPIFWTCGTTAVGFAALLSSEITPVRSFGLMMSLATLLVFAIVAVLAPGGMARWRRPNGEPGDEDLAGSTDTPERGPLDLIFGDPVPPPAERYLIGLLEASSRFVARFPAAVASIALVIVAVSALGLGRLEVETDFSRNFRESSDLVRSLDFVESKLGGAGTWEVNFDAPEVLTDEYLDHVRGLAARLRRELLVRTDETGQAESAAGRLTKVVCLTDGLDLVPREIGVSFFKTKLSLDQRLGLLSSMQGELLTSLYSADQRRMRIVLRGLERQRSEQKLELIARVRELALQSVDWDAAVSPSDLPDTETGDAPPRAAAAAAPPQTTGVFVLLTFLIESLLRDQIVSFVIAAVGIGSMMAFAFRSVTIGLISLVPNLFPIVLVVGSMGWIGLPINIATAMIASVSMGLTVDCSIHYLSAFRLSRRGGATVAEALERTQTQVGRALVFANVALVAGFSVLTLSHFIPLVYFGILVSAAMLGGLAGNLFLLPLMLSLLDRDDTIAAALPPEAESAPCPAEPVTVSESETSE